MFVVYYIDVSLFFIFLFYVYFVSLTNKRTSVFLIEHKNENASGFKFSYYTDVK